MAWPSHPRYRGRAEWFLRKTSRLWEGTVMGLVIDIVLFVAGMAGGMLVVSYASRRVWGTCRRGVRIRNGTVPDGTWNDIAPSRTDIGPPSRGLDGRRSSRASSDVFHR